MKPSCCTYCRVNRRFDCGLQEKCTRVQAFYRRQQEMLLDQYTIRAVYRTKKRARLL